MYHESVTAQGSTKFFTHNHKERAALYRILHGKVHPNQSSYKVEDIRLARENYEKLVAKKKE